MKSVSKVDGYTAVDDVKLLVIKWVGRRDRQGLLELIIAPDDSITNLTYSWVDVTDRLITQLHGYDTELGDIQYVYPEGTRPEVTTKLLKSLRDFVEPKEMRSDSLGKLTRVEALELATALARATIFVSYVSSMVGKGSGDLTTGSEQLTVLVDELRPEVFSRDV